MNAVYTSFETFPVILDKRYILPDCFFVHSSLTSITAYNVIVITNATVTDPFDRLLTAMNASFTTSIRLFSSTMSGPTAPSYTPNWSQFFTYVPRLGQLSLEDCDIEGSLPSTLPPGLTLFNVNGNRLTGSIPPAFLSSYSSASSGLSFVWQLSGNSLNGEIPSSLFNSLPAHSSFQLFLDHNSLVGTIPADLFTFNQASTLVSFTFNFGFNPGISHSLLSDLWGLPTSQTELTSFYIYASSISLSGTIPSTWISQYAFPQLTTSVISLSNCSISGDIHAGIIPNSASMTTHILDLKNNPLITSITSEFLPAILSNGYSSNAGVPNFQLDVTNCSITGVLELPSPSTNAPLLPLVSIAAKANALVSLTVHPNATSYLYNLDISDNPVQGTLDNLFSSSPSTLSALNVDNTSLSGNMPYMALMDNSKLQIISMKNVAIDFCGGDSARASWSSYPARITCSLQNTNASGCSSLYPGCDVTGVATPIASPISCPNATRPSSQFYCINGTWVSNTTVTTPALIIPSGATETIVIGDVESTSIVFSGLGSTLVIQGCALNLTSVTLTLEAEDLKGNKTIVQQLIVLANSNCSSDSLDSLKLESKVNGTTCRKVKTAKAVSNGQLSGIFTIDSSSCNTWWIILVSVICGAVVIGVLILALLTYGVPRLKAAIRPFSRPRAQDAEVR